MGAQKDLHDEVYQLNQGILHVHAVWVNLRGYFLEAKLQFPQVNHAERSENQEVPVVVGNHGQKSGDKVKWKLASNVRECNIEHVVAVKVFSHRDELQAYADQPKNVERPKQTTGSMNKLWCVYEKGGHQEFNWHNNEKAEHPNLENQLFLTGN